PTARRTPDAHRPEAACRAHDVHGGPARSRSRRRARQTRSPRRGQTPEDPLRLGGRPGAARSRLPGGHRLRRRLAPLRTSHQDGARSRTRRFRKRAAPLPPVGRQEHPGLRRPARPAARSEKHLLLRPLPPPPRRPPFFFSPTGTLSNITDDFLPLDDGGFLVTQMGSHTGGTPGRVAEFDRNLQLAGEWPPDPPEHDFNPHGISARPDLNLMVTSDFMMPASPLNVVPGDPLLRATIRVWALHKPAIVRPLAIPSPIPTMPANP